jgi:hypothetical protein
MGEFGEAGDVLGGGSEAGAHGGDFEVVDAKAFPGGDLFMPGGGVTGAVVEAGLEAEG